MKNTTSTIVLSVLLLLIPHRASPKSAEIACNSIVATWKEIGSPNDLSSILRFTDDGILIHAFIVITDYSFVSSSNLITITPKYATKNIPVKQYSYILSPPTMQLIDKHGTTLLLKRINEPWTQNDSDIYGKWSFDTPKGATGYYIFNHNSTMSLVLLMPGATASKYLILGDKIKIIRGKTNSSLLDFTIDDTGVLTLREPSKDKQWKYKNISDLIPNITVN